MDSFPTEPQAPGEHEAPEAEPSGSCCGGSGEGAHSALQRLKELERSQPASPDPQEPR